MHKKLKRRTPKTVSAYKMKKETILILITGIFFSCSTLKRIQPNDNKKINNVNSLKAINGDYKLNQNEHCGGMSLDAAFDFKTEFNCINKPYSTYFMRLTTLDEKRIKAELFQGNKLIEEKTLRGKLRKNYFIINASLKFPLFYGIFNVYRSRKTRIGVLPNGNLTIDNDTGGCGMLVVLPLICSGNDSYGIKYKRIK